MRLRVLLPNVVLAVVALAVAACGSTGPASAPTPASVAACPTLIPVPSAPTPTPVLPTPTFTPVPPTPTVTPLPPPSKVTVAPPAPTHAPGDTPRGATLGFGCEEHRGRMGLIISADAAEEHAVITSYRCGGTHIDSTGVSPSRTPGFVIPVGRPLRFAWTRTKTRFPWTSACIPVQGRQVPSSCGPRNFPEERLRWTNSSLHRLLASSTFPPCRPASTPW